MQLPTISEVLLSPHKTVDVYLQQDFASPFNDTIAPKITLSLTYNMSESVNLT